MRGPSTTAHLKHSTKACPCQVGSLTSGHQLEPVSQMRSLVSRARGTMRQLLTTDRKIEPTATPARV